MNGKLRALLVATCLATACHHGPSVNGTALAPSEACADDWYVVVSNPTAADYVVRIQEDPLKPATSRLLGTAEYGISRFKLDRWYPEKQILMGASKYPPLIPRQGGNKAEKARKWLSCEK
jgi:hypothetical protein